MKGLTKDFIAIDTNVFGHLTSNRYNADRHIHELLRVSSEEKGKIALLVDTGREILEEYKTHLQPKRLEAKERWDEAQILKYWMFHAPTKKIVVDKSGLLWKAILEAIPEQEEETDRIFVYVAFKKGRILISNDRKHIVNRRPKLMVCRKNGYCGSGADVMCSREAYGKIST